VNEVGNPPEWLAKLLYRLLTFRAPGVYEFLLIVEENGRRRIVVKNASQPHRIENLSQDQE
jgi:hypothetical protein